MSVFAQGLALGLFTTLFLWAFNRTVLRARLVFSSQVSVVSSPYSPTAERVRYRVKVKNVSLFRGVADVRFDATLVAQGVSPRSPRTWVRIRLSVSSDGTATLGPGRNRIISLRFDEFTAFMRTNMLDYGHPELADAKHLGIRTLIRRLEDAAGDRSRADSRPYLEVTAVVTEAWTGKQYVVTSPRYGPDDLQDRPFRTNTSAARRRVARMRTQWHRLRDALAERQRRRHKDLQLQAD